MANAGEMPARGGGGEEPAASAVAGRWFAAVAPRGAAGRIAGVAGRGAGVAGRRAGAARRRAGCAALAGQPSGVPRDHALVVRDQSIERAQQARRLGVAFAAVKHDRDGVREALVIGWQSDAIAHRAAAIRHVVGPVVRVKGADATPRVPGSASGSHTGNGRVGGPEHPAAGAGHGHPTERRRQEQAREHATCRPAQQPIELLPVPMHDRSVGRSGR